MTTLSLNKPRFAFVSGRSAMRFLVIASWCAIAFGCALRLTQLPTRVLFLDESITQMRVSGHTGAELNRTLYDGKQRPIQALRRYSMVDSGSTAQKLLVSLSTEDAQHPPLFYLAELGIVHIFGNSLIVWRLLPALCGILALPAAYALARELFSDARAGLMAAALFAVSPIERIYSEQAREYSLLTLVILLATFAVVRAVRKSTRRAWTFYSILAIAGLYTNPFMAYVMAGHAVFVVALARRSSYRLFLAYVTACVVALAAYAPWIYELTIHRAQIASTNAWSATHWPLARLATKWIFNAGSTFFDLEYIDLRLAVILLVAVPVAAIAVVRAFRAAGNDARWCLGAGIVVPTLMLIVPDIILGGHRSSVARYGLPIFAMLLILVARGVRSLPISATILLGIGLISSTVSVVHPSWWDNDANADDAPIAAAIGNEPRAQVITSVAPFELATIARFLGNDVQFSLSPNLSSARFSRNDPLFVLRPSSRDLNALHEMTKLTFVRVRYAQTQTAHQLGLRIASTGNNERSVGELYKASR